MKYSIADIVAASSGALNTVLKPKALWLGLLGVVFLVSVGASMALPYRRPAVIWFPDSRSADGSQSRAELRYIPRGLDKAEEASALVQEILLGPMSTLSRPIAVPDANIRSSIRSGKTLYIDLSGDILFGRQNAQGIADEPPMPPRVAIAYLARNLRWNYPSMRILLTVNGLEPSWEAFKTPQKAKSK